ncbi:MAG: hypothetical protein FWF31_00940 [Desulfobulbus sp.]|nr:hypothetical protein [Desulfobulbus sp.]
MDEQTAINFLAALSSFLQELPFNPGNLRIPGAKWPPFRRENGQYKLSV